MSVTLEFNFGLYNFLSNTGIRAGFSWWESWGPARGRRNFGLKSGGTKLEAPKAPRIEMLKASKGMRNREGTSLPSDLGVWGSGRIIS